MKREIEIVHNKSLSTENIKCENKESHAHMEAKVRSQGM